MAAQTPEPGAFPYPAGLRDLHAKKIEENISAAIQKLESITPTTSLPPWKTENELYRSAYHYMISLEAVNGIYDLTPTPQSKPSSPRSECTYAASYGTRATTIPSSPSPTMINKEENRGDSMGRSRELGPRKRKVTGRLLAFFSILYI